MMAAVLALAGGCTKAQAPPASAGLLRTATIKDIMDSMVDPSGDFLFESVVQIADERGITEKAPRTDDEWEAVRHHALILLEAPNLAHLAYHYGVNPVRSVIKRGREVHRAGNLVASGASVSAKSAGEIEGSPR